MLWDFLQILELKSLKKTITAAEEERSDGKKMWKTKHGAAGSGDDQRCPALYENIDTISSWFQTPDLSRSAQALEPISSTQSTSTNQEFSCNAPTKLRDLEAKLHMSWWKCATKFGNCFSVQLLAGVIRQGGSASTWFRSNILQAANSRSHSARAFSSSS